MKVYDELMNEVGGPERKANRYRVKRQSKEQRAANLEAIRKYIADKKKKKKVDEGLLKRYFAKRRAKKEARAQEKAASRKEREDKEFEASVAKEPKRTRDRLDKQKRMQKAAAEQDKDPSVAGTDNPSKLKDPGEPAPPKRNGFAASGNGNGMRLSRDVSHTEHEGPSLAEAGLQRLLRVAKIKWETHSQVGGRQRDEEDVAHSIGMHHGRKELINKKMRKLLARKASREARDK